MYIYRVDRVPFPEENEDFQVHLRSFSTFEKAFTFIALFMQRFNQVLTDIDHTAVDETEEELHYYYVENNFNDPSIYTIHKELVDYISFN